MSVRDHLIRILADGEFHSGSMLAGTLGVSRSAVWKQIHRLDTLGLEVESIRGSGYRLAAPIELLERERLMAHLDAAARSSCEALEVVCVTASTNATLIAQPAPAAGRWRGALAEYQTGGRGRRGRRWVSPFGSGLCLSLSWSFAAAPADLPALSLATGVGVMRALAGVGANGLALKWPNDIMLAGGKLGGILVDVDGESGGPLRAVVGLGLNLVVGPALVRGVAGDGGLPPAALASAAPGHRVARNALAARLIAELCRILREYAKLGFAALADEWRAHDFLYGRRVTVRNGGDELRGLAGGIAPDGALLLEGPEGIGAVMNGDVTLRSDA